MDKNLIFPEAALNELKLQFFEDLLKHDTSVQQQFESFLERCTDKLNVSLEDVTAFMNGHRQAIKEALESIDFEDLDYDSYTAHSGYYVPEYEIEEELAAEKLNVVLSGFLDECNEYATSFRYDKAVLAIVAHYEGSMLLDIDCETIDLESELEYTMKEGLKKMCSILWQISIPENQAITIINTLLDRLHTQRELSENLTKFIQPILDLTIFNSKTAVRFREKCEQLKISSALLARNMVTAAKFEHGIEAWKNAALEWYKSDALIAEELLHYFHKNDFKSFVLTAESLWEADLFKHEFAEYFYDYVSYENSPMLAKQVALYLTYRKDDPAYYQSVVKYLTINERNAFIDKCSFRNKLYISLLAFEARYDDALRHLEKKADLFNLAELINIISIERPHECFVLIRSKIRETLSSARSRSTYEVIAGLIRIAYNLNGYQAQTQSLINELYARKPALPALKSELQMAGFLPQR